MGFDVKKTNSKDRSFMKGELKILSCMDANLKHLDMISEQDKDIQEFNVRLNFHEPKEEVKGQEPDEKLKFEFNPNGNIKKRRE